MKHRAELKICFTRLRRGAIALAVASALPAVGYADDWVSAPADTNFSNGANWTDGTAPSGPTAEARFGATNTPSVLIAPSTTVTLGSLVFDNAPSYTLMVGASGVLGLRGSGIQVNSSATPQIIADSGARIELGSSSIGSPSTSAGSAFLKAQNGGSIYFYGTSTNADAQLSLDQYSFAQFHDSATAGSSLALIDNNFDLSFAEQSSAGAARIETSALGTTTFRDSSTAQSSILNNSGTLNFTDNATAANATITTSTGGVTAFTGTSTAGNATIVTESGGTLAFYDDATAGNAALVTNGAGTVSFEMATAGSQITAGSIEGDGLFVLGGGGTNLTVGGLNTSTTVDGQITDYDMGGSLTKVGTGTLTLTGANDYTGGTFLNEGILRISANNNLGANSSALTFGGGTLQLGAAVTFGSTRSIVVGAGGGTVDTNGFNSAWNLGITGTGSFTKTGTGVLTLAGNSTHSGGTTVSAGTLQIGGGGTAGSLSGDVTNNATLTFNRSGTLNYGGVISGTGRVIKSGSGTVTFTGNSNYGGGTTVNAGTLQVGNGGTTGSIGGNVTNNATLAFNRSDNSTFGGAISGTGAVTKLGAGTLTYTGANVYTGVTTINAGTLQIGDGGTSGSVTGNITNNAALAFNRSNSSNYGGVISGAGTVTKLGAGTLTYTGANTYTGATTISAGTLQIGDGGNTGSIAGNVTNNATLAFNRLGNVDYGGVISGTGAVTKLGAGTLTYTGANTYAGTTTISAGTLQIGNGGTTGSIAGNVANSGTLVFNRSDSTTYGGAVSGTGAVTKLGGGTLTLTGANTHSGGTSITAGTLQIGDGGTSGSITGNVANSGALTFNRSDSSVFDGVISGTGSVTKLGGGTLAYTGSNTYSGTTTVSGGTLQIGNGGTTGAIAGGVINNGTLAFNRSDTFDFSGDISGSGSVTQAGSGVLTLTGTNTYTNGTSINAGTLRVLDDSNLGAASSGLTFGGGTLEVTGDTTITRSVTLASSGTIDTSGFNTTIESVVAGGGTLNKAGAGTLTLTGANTYSGETTISAGTLQIGNGGTSGNISGGVVNNGTLAFNRSDAFNFGGNITGTGSVTHAGSNVLTLTGTNTYSGGTTINSGTLRVLADGNLGAASGGLTFGGGTLQLTGSTTLARTVALGGAGGTIDTNGFNVTLSNVASGTGGLTKVGAGTLALAAANTYSGGTTVSSGTLQIGSGGTSGSIAGNVTNNATLAFNRSDNSSYSGVVSGSGAVTKIGAGTLVLNGVNTYTGQTNVNGGTVELSGGGRINNTSRVEIAQSSGTSGALRVTGAGSGITTTGDIVVGFAGNGTLTVDSGGALAASSIRLGETTGSTGTLNIGAGGAAGTLNAATIIDGIGAGSSVILNHTDSAYTLGANLLHTLSVNHNGTGTTTLTGTNGYTGGTFLNAGTLRVSSNNSLGGAASALSFNGGTLKWDATITNLPRAIVLNSGGGTMDTGSFTVTSTGTISGSGGLTKTGTGVLNLNGNSTYTGGTTVSGGSLRGTTNSLKNGIVNNGNVTFLQTASGTYSGSMSGTGTLTKLNAGNLTMSGTNTYTGATTVTGGTLTVSGSLASPVTVGQSGTISGTGTINGAVNVSGTFAPGNPSTAPFGTLTVNGNLTFAPTSIFRVQTDELGSNGKINVTGVSHSVTINGGTVEVMTGGGEYEPSTNYTLISAAGGITGTFDSIGTDFTFLDPSLTYDANNVHLTLTRNDVLFSSVAETSNQRASATYLQSLSGDSGTAALVRSILNLNADDARTAFGQIAGDGLIGLGRISQAQSARFMETLATRLGGGVPGGGSYGVARELDTQTMRRREASFFQSSSVNRGMWMRSFGLKGELPGDANTTATDWEGSGTAVGFDAPLSNNVLMGASFLYGRNEVGLDDGRSGSARIKSPQLAVYGSYSDAGNARNGWQVRGLVGYAQPSISSERLVTLGNESSVARSRHQGRELSVGGEAEVSHTMDGFRLQGMVGLRASQLQEDGFTETGSAANLEVSGRTTQSVASSLGARLLVPTYRNHALFDLRAVWSHELAGGASDMSAKLADAESLERFAVDGASVGRDALTLGVGFSGRLKRNLSFYSDYSLELRGAGQTQHTALAGVRYVW